MGCARERRTHAPQHLLCAWGDGARTRAGGRAFPHRSRSPPLCITVRTHPSCRAAHRRTHAAAAPTASATAPTSAAAGRSFVWARLASTFWRHADLARPKPCAPAGPSSACDLADPNPASRPPLLRCLWALAGLRSDGWPPAPCCTPGRLSGRCHGAAGTRRLRCPNSSRRSTRSRRRRHCRRRWPRRCRR
eukprot:6113057-Prymnesium_polylepis.2